jgi:DNA-binding LytR/AlgR family response regulator
MRVRVERIGDDKPEEVVVYCREITPEVESIIRKVSQAEQHRQMPSFFKGDDQIYLSFAEILFFETDSERVYAHTADNAYEVSARLYELDAMLPGYFVRVSRSAIINIKHVFSIQKGLTRVNLISFRQSHKEVYGSRMYSQVLFNKMNERFMYDIS